MGRTRTTTEIEEISDDERIWPEHPLFPLEPDEKSYEVSWILVSRIEEGVQKHGPNILASELMTEQDIVNRFGGGHYVIIARALSKNYDGQPGRFTKHRKIHLPGISKPLSPDPTPQEQKMANPTMKPEVATSPMGADPMSFFGMMLQMNQASLERERQASEKAQQANQQFMQMFMTVMQGSKADSQNMMQMMMTMSSQQQQSMLQFITAMMGSRGGGPEELARYAELLRTLGMGGQKEQPKEGGEQSIGAMLENAADFVQGIVALKGVTAGAPSSPALPLNGEAPAGMGGAASLLRGMR